MDWNIIITPIVSVVCSAVTGVVTWLLTRKKYNTEVEHNSIENMEGSLDFYEKLSASNSKILEEVLNKYEEVIKTNTALVLEVQSLRTQISLLTEVINNEVDAVDFEKYGIIINEDGTLTRI
jgi:hypothetical protein